jgi:hypothetical protein
VNAVQARVQRAGSVLELDGALRRPRVRHEPVERHRPRVEDGERAEPPAPHEVGVEQLGVALRREGAGAVAVTVTPAHAPRGRPVAILALLDAHRGYS